MPIPAAAPRPKSCAAASAVERNFRVLNGALPTLVGMPLRPLLAPFSALLLVLGVACSDREPAPSESTATSTSTTTAVSRSTTTAAAATKPPGSATATPPATIAALPTTLPGAASRGPANHDGDRTLANIKTLTETIGVRVSGTDGEQRTVDWVAAEFRKSGYDVEIMEFEFDTGGYTDDSLLVGGENVASRRFNGSGTTEVTGAGVYVGLADAAGLRGKNVTGKIAVADRGTLTFSDKYANVKAAGAIALIVINTESGLFAGRLEPSVDEPVIGVGQEDGQVLRAAVDSGQQIQVKVPSFHAKNVIARPAAGAECRVLAGGHHDTVPGVVGATDNASGTAMVVELARAFASDGLDAGLCFVTFGAEESGLHGSNALANRLKREGKLPAVYLNLDCTSTGTSLEVIGDRGLSDDAVVVAQALGVTARATADPAGSSSDHASFLRAGVPAIFLATNDFSKIHTTGDTIAIINPKLLDQVGDLAYELITGYEKKFARG